MKIKRNEEDMCKTLSKRGNDAMVKKPIEYNFKPKASINSQRCWA